jgi:hypothetical protein
LTTQAYLKAMTSPRTATPHADLLSPPRGQAIITPPAEIDLTNAGQLGGELNAARERAGNPALRGEIEVKVCFATRLDRVSILGTGGFRGTRGYWISAEVRNG